MLFSAHQPRGPKKWTIGCGAGTVRVNRTLTVEVFFGMFQVIKVINEF